MVSTMKQMKDKTDEQLLQDKDMDFLWDAINEIKGTEIPVIEQKQEIVQSFENVSERQEIEEIQSEIP